MAEPQPGLDAPLRIWPRKQIPYTWIQLDRAAGEHGQEPFLSLQTPSPRLPLLVDEGASSADSGACACSKAAPSCCTWAEPLRPLSFSSRTSGPKRSTWGCLPPNATLATALFVEARARRSFPRLWRPQTPGWRAEAPLLGEAEGVADLRCTGPSGPTCRSSPQLRSRRLTHTCRPASEATQGRVGHQAAMATG